MAFLSRKWMYSLALGFVLLIASFVLKFVYNKIPFVITLLVFLIYVVANCYACRKKRAREDDQHIGDTTVDVEELQTMSPIRCTFEQLRRATNEFRETLGAGGFGTVHRGSLENGQAIAVKRLRRSDQGKKEFVAEVRTIGSIHHINLVKLIGYCAEKAHRAVVYEFMPNGSLEKWIFHREGETSPLSWLQRKIIILGIAKGLAYLHEECAWKIAHLDIKPQNILLDGKLQPKISDFGLSRLIDRDQSQVLTKPGGTPGYTSPEVYRGAAISVKADVYSYGVVIAEIVCARKNLIHGQSELVSVLMANANQENGILVGLVDPSNKDMQLHRVEAARMLMLAIWCLQLDPFMRPPMSVVVQVLKGNISIPTDLDHRSLRTSTVEASILSAPR